MRTVIALFLGLAAVSMFGVVTAEAQTQPKAFSWERKTNQLLRPKRVDQLRSSRRALRGASEVLKLPENRIFRRNDGVSVTAPADQATRFGQLDSDGDGYVSRGEYMTNRSRPARNRGYRSNRLASRQSRLNSRFRTADRNRDGRLSSAELQQIKNRRF